MTVAPHELHALRLFHNEPNAGPRSTLETSRSQFRTGVDVKLFVSIT
jgi:hypothetical protein